MPDETNSAQLTKLFVCCFEFSPDEELVGSEDDADDDDGTFQIVVEARDVDDAVSKCRARLHEIATTSGSLGPVVVYANAFIETASGDLTRGLIVNHQKLGDVLFYSYLPEQGATGATEHFLDDEEGEEADTHDDETDASDYDEDGDGRTVPVFWAKWKLYWCETGDGDEDWFVIARTAWEAERFHENMEGYDEGDASAEFVCVLPDLIQRQAEREGGGWPSADVLLACGAEFIPHVPQDGFGDLREKVGSGARVVRINGRVYSEGDVVSNTIQRLGGEGEPDA
ncbi:Hypothetical protein A7982_03854 [Minicystis rosea]|nr:Hypothetical protein A7982_03854 [Minicystis rosea]